MLRRSCNLGYTPLFLGLTWVIVAIAWGLTIYTKKGRPTVPVVAQALQEYPNSNLSTPVMLVQDNDQKASVQSSECNPAMIAPVHPIPPAPPEIEELRKR